MVSISKGPQHSLFMAVESGAHASITPLEKQKAFAWGATGADPASSFASVLAGHAPTAPEPAQIYIPVLIQPDSCADGNNKLQEDYSKWQNMMEQVQKTSNSRLVVKPRLRRRKDRDTRDNFDGIEAESIVLNADLLKEFFHMPLNIASKKIGVCATALKQACRKIGIKRWPHRMLKNMAMSMGKSPASLRVEFSFSRVASSSDSSSCLERQDTMTSSEDSISGFEMGGDSLDGWAHLFSQPTDQLHPSYQAVLADCNAKPNSNNSVKKSIPAEQEQSQTTTLSEQKQAVPTRYIQAESGASGFASAAPTLPPVSFSPPHNLSVPAPFRPNPSSMVQESSLALRKAGRMDLMMDSGLPHAHREASVVTSQRVQRKRENESEEEGMWEQKTFLSECERLQAQVRELVVAQADILQLLLANEDGLSRESEVRAELEQHIAVLEHAVSSARRD